MVQREVGRGGQNCLSQTPRHSQVLQPAQTGCAGHLGRAHGLRVPLAGTALGITSTFLPISQMRKPRPREDAAHPKPDPSLEPGAPTLSLPGPRGGGGHPLWRP